MLRFSKNEGSCNRDKGTCFNCKNRVAIGQALRWENSSGRAKPWCIPCVDRAIANGQGAVEVDVVVSATSTVVPAVNTVIQGISEARVIELINESEARIEAAINDAERRLQKYLEDQLTKWANYLTGQKFAGVKVAPVPQTKMPKSNLAGLHTPQLDAALAALDAAEDNPIPF